MKNCTIAYGIYIKDTYGVEYSIYIK